MVRPNAGLLTALLDMLVDGKFDLKKSPVFRVCLPNLVLEMKYFEIGLICASFTVVCVWPNYKRFSFSCWVCVESFPTSGRMGLFSFLSESSKGCLAVLAKDRLLFESIYQKRQCVSFPINLIGKKWHFLCITHSIGRAFSGGSHLRWYLDEVLVSS
ncbi:putative concanavalin A-like lectin/glucanase domain superfamily [Helianthus annuus]|nr:putative concanavalin A-like lectin/glucanase domain superfamily [Helianthus annuus]KAJ0621183.1 putative concanavalin A-like lectin/glucanase domain superfamily [Helianthus annuus]KAJ0625717.1 putative concanavalin A-like lectin/glucanase domain superfamily [Helianthus annuus]KAJ0782094.1 putative concanavalin A-like lectin/glucanase domain superfamily [Helianthus annuus]KAJ0946591.1 putative concanavalin A-like lectin/glucanase domain superfamily [Helianthus annuus]